MFPFRATPSCFQPATIIDYQMSFSRGIYVSKPCSVLFFLCALAISGCARGDDELLERAVNYLTSAPSSSASGTKWEGNIAGTRVATLDGGIKVVEALSKSGGRTAHILFKEANGTWELLGDQWPIFERDVFNGREEEFLKRMWDRLSRQENAEIELPEKLQKRFALSLDERSLAAELTVEFNYKLVKSAIRREGQYIEHYRYDHPAWDFQEGRVFIRVQR